jgi:hypothetical protein
MSILGSYKYPDLQADQSTYTAIKVEIATNINKTMNLNPMVLLLVFFFFRLACTGRSLYLAVAAAADHHQVLFLISNLVLLLATRDLESGAGTRTDVGCME